MQFRQNGQRDERRRRVLREELLTTPAIADQESPESAGPDGEHKVAARGYSAAVSVESQPPISCLIATRPWTLTVLVLAGLAVIVGLEAAYANMIPAAGLPSEVTAAFEVDAKGSLASWFSSVLLSMAAVNAVLVYWLRSHKLDDYRGRYRVWLWAAVGLALAAVNVSTGLHAVVGYLIASRFATPWLQDSIANGVVLQALVFGSLAVRLGFEIWPSRLARSSSLVAAIGYLAAVLIRLDVLAIDSIVLTAMAESTALLVANLAAAITVAAFCRYVHLEAQGALKPRRDRRASQVPASQGKESQPAPAEPAKDAAPNRTLRKATINAKSIRCDSPHQSRGEARSAGLAAPATKAEAKVPQPAVADNRAAEEDDISDFDPETGERLSKSERRRLRKQLRRQKRTGSGQTSDE